MSGDFSRVRFDPSNDFSGVLMQQGRVQLDSDWNEGVAASDRRMRAAIVDLLNTNTPLGGSGVAIVSQLTPYAFKLKVVNGVLTIGRGRMYVDGLLVENHGNKDEPPTFDPVLAELQWPDTLPYDKQPYFPFANLTHFTPGQYLAYLEVWQREVTHLQYPELLEPALGVDTTTRVQTVWQVRFLPVEKDSCCPPDGNASQWKALTRPSRGRLSTKTETKTGQDTEPCKLQPNEGYRGHENQLYRIQIHEGGSFGTATFKWSRDNATVASNVEGIVAHNSETTTLELASLGRDAVLCFKTGDWVEVLDDQRELSGENNDALKRRGSMHKISVDVTAQTITCKPALPNDLLPTFVEGAYDVIELGKQHTRVIRWESAPIQITDDKCVDLEDGIQVRFSIDSGDGGEFLCGDYWLAAARTSNASIELLNNEPPRGVHRHYAPLAMVTFADGQPPLPTDCPTGRPSVLPPQHGGCCTVTLSPSDLTAGTTLNTVVNRYAGSAKNTIICLLPGNYCLPEPLRLDKNHSGLTLKGCKGAVFCVSKDSEADFTHGMVVIDDGDDITLSGIRFDLPLVPFKEHHLANLPPERLKQAGIQFTDGLYVSIGVRVLHSNSLSIDHCEFSFKSVESPKCLFGVGVFGGGRCIGLSMEGNRFEGAISSDAFHFQAGYMLASAAAFNALISHELKASPGSKHVGPSPSQPDINSMNSEKGSTDEDGVTKKEIPLEVVEYIDQSDDTINSRGQETGVEYTFSKQSDDGVKNKKIPDEVIQIVENIGQFKIAEEIGQPVFGAVPGTRPPKSPTLAPNGGSVMTATLSEAVLKNNNFSGLSAAMLVFGDSGAVKVTNNEVTGGAGFWFLAPQLMDLLAFLPYSDPILFGSTIGLAYPLLGESKTGVTYVQAAEEAIRIYTGDTPFTDSQGNVWIPDDNHPFLSIIGYSSKASCKNKIRISGAKGDEPLYQKNERYGNKFGYVFNRLSKGYYQVTLKFAEIFHSQIERVFSVSINGDPVLTDFDISKTNNGKYKAKDQVFRWITPKDGKIEIKFTASDEKQDAKISAVEISSQLYQAGSGDLDNFLVQLKTLTQQAYAGTEALPLKLRVDNNNVDQATSIAMLAADFPQGSMTNLMTMNGNIFRRISGQNTTAGATAAIGWVNIFTATGNQILNRNGNSIVFLSSEESITPAMVGNVIQAQ